jgi:ABC-type lipoprotein release transport system permease subunit
VAHLATRRRLALSTVVALIVVVGVLASLLPALRAMRIEPMAALRQE